MFRGLFSWRKEWEENVGPDSWRGPNHIRRASFAPVLRRRESGANHIPCADFASLLRFLVIFHPGEEKKFPSREIDGCACACASFALHSNLNTFRRPRPRCSHPRRPPPPAPPAAAPPFFIKKIFTFFPLFLNIYCLYVRLTKNNSTKKGLICCPSCCCSC